MQIVDIVVIVFRAHEALGKTQMVVKQKPAPKVVKKSAKELAKPGVKKIERAEDARILDDQKNAPKPHKPAPKKPPPKKR